MSHFMPWVLIQAIRFSLMLNAVLGFHNYQRRSRSPGTFLSPKVSTSNEQSVTAFIPTVQSRKDAQTIMDNQLMPKQQYSERIGWGRDAQGLNTDAANTALNPNDPRLSKTYAEFPLTSFDQLLDLALQYLPPSKNQKDRLSLVDIGSGCGRLVFYSAMTLRGSPNGVVGSWNVQGIEISDLLHQRAVEYVDQGLLDGLFYSNASTTMDNCLSLHWGPAEDYTTLLQNADIIFAYSTAFSAKAFSPELGALLLDPEWSRLLRKSCSAGCIAITTDRALDPAYDWELVDRLDVANPELFGTTGYIHILR